MNGYNRGLDTTRFLLDRGEMDTTKFFVGFIRQREE
jgi:hypothetical protein